MSEMISKVARAIWQQERAARVHDEPFKLSWYEDTARAAIQAMRDPTEAMFDATGEPGVPDRVYREYWEAMIDQALQDEKEGGE